MEVNNVVLNVLACLYDKRIRDAISKRYEFKITSLENINMYTKHEKFQRIINNKDSINDNNFSTCLNIVIERLSDDNFRLFLEKTKVCHIVFYKKEDRPKVDLLDPSLKAEKPVVDVIKNFIIKYEINDNSLVLYINPINVYKDKILDNQAELLGYFNANLKDVELDNVIIKLIHNDKELDSLSETLLDLGFSIS